ncbi:hypothetical protein HWV62_11552 [Athelia sp. TMB]|nr:hypothetical protein HWV62_11552 [Athelia sp. TMB]
MDSFHIPPIDEFPWDHLMQFVAEPMDPEPAPNDNAENAPPPRYSNNKRDSSHLEVRPIAKRTPSQQPGQQLLTPPHHNGMLIDPFQISLHSSSSRSSSGSPDEDTDKGRGPSIQSTPYEDNAYVSVSTTFFPGSPQKSSQTDIILLSDDSVWFYVDSDKLHGASDNLVNNLLPPHPTPNGKPDFNFGPIISVPESSRVLNILLHAIYEMSPANYNPSFTDLSRAAYLLPQYGIYIPTALATSPPSPLYTLLAAQAKHHPLDLYILAAQLNVHPLASHASQYLHSICLSDISDEEALKIGPIYLKRLFFLHYGRADALKRILLAPPHPHPPTKQCDYLDQRGLTRAWALASAYLAWDSRADVSTDMIESALTPLSNQLTCDLCRGVLQERISKLMSDWGAIKRKSHRLELKRLKRHSLLRGIQLKSRPGGAASDRAGHHTLEVANTKMEDLSEDEETKPKVKVEEQLCYANTLNLEASSFFKVEESKVKLETHTIYEHLAGLTDLSISTSLAPPVRRRFLTDKYGVHPQWIITCFKKGKNPVPPNQERVVVCCTAERNPVLPLVPGGRGFLLSNRFLMCEKPFSLFTRIYVGGKPRWRYEGEYKGTHTGYISHGEFMGQSEAVGHLNFMCALNGFGTDCKQVKRAWAAKIAKANSHEEYVDMKANIYRWKVQKYGDASSVNEKDVIQALSNCDSNVLSFGA